MTETTDRAVAAALVVLDVPAGDTELAVDALLQAGASAVEERRGPKGAARLIADADGSRVERPAGTDWHLSVQPVDPSQPWLDTWREHAKPVHCGEHVVLEPAWVPASHPDRHDVRVRLDPGRVFGSGSHPTTRLAVAALERHVHARTTVLDVGCGSGVLAVVAALLGAAEVTAVDVDPAAVATTCDNAARNAVASVVQASSTPVDAITGHFDVVVANIDRPTLLDIGSSLARVVGPHGVLVVSGVLEGSGDEVAMVCAPLVIERADTLDGWLSLELRRPA